MSKQKAPSISSFSKVCIVLPVRKTGVSLTSELAMKVVGLVLWKYLRFLVNKLGSVISS